MASRATRPYQKRRRAEAEAQTRRRITEAAAKLHGTLGPARTTIKDIAAQAGVQRGTVYRHFPDLESLFLACSAHWASLNPPPEPASWDQIEDPQDRLRTALSDLYRWYEWAEPMLTNVLRDAPLVPAMAGAFEPFQQRQAAVHAALMRGRQARGRARAQVRAALGHALEFTTWQSLTRSEGLSRRAAVELMCALAAAAARPPQRASGPRSRGSRRRP